MLSVSRDHRGINLNNGGHPMWNRLYSAWAHFEQIVASRWRQDRDDAMELAPEKAAEILSSITRHGRLCIACGRRISRHRDKQSVRGATPSA